MSKKHVPFRKRPRLKPAPRPGSWLIFLSAALLSAVVMVMPCPGQGYSTYYDLDLSFEYPRAWSIAEEEGDYPEGAVTFHAPVGDGTLELSWNDGFAGFDPATILDLRVNALLLDPFYDNVTVLNRSTVPLKDENATMWELSYDVDVTPYAARYVAFTSPPSERFILMKYAVRTEVGLDTAGFTHLLETWGDGIEPPSAPAAGEGITEGMTEEMAEETGEGGALREPAIQWNVTLGGQGYESVNSIMSTCDGGYVLVGITNSYGDEDYDGWMIKTDQEGREIWNRTFGDGNTDQCVSVAETEDGFVLAGITTSYGAGGQDLWLIKTDLLGEVIWDRTYGAEGDDGGSVVLATGDGGYLVLGRTASSVLSGEDIWLIKTDSRGMRVWERTYGGWGNDSGKALLDLGGGGYVIAGRTESEGSGTDVWLIKLDPMGDEVWNTTFGGPTNEFVNSIQQTPDGGYILAGGTEFYEPKSDLLLIKTDSSGHVLWNKEYPRDGDDWANSVHLAGDGYLMVGVTGSRGSGGEDVWLIRSDSEGNILWEKTFGGEGDDVGWAAHPSPDGGHVVAGSTESFGAGNKDIWLIKVR